MLKHLHSSKKLTMPSSLKKQLFKKLVLRSLLTAGYGGNLNNLFGEDVGKEAEMRQTGVYPTHTKMNL